MNDLLAKALDGLEVAYRVTRTRALMTVGVLGFVVSAVLVVAAGRVGASRATQPLTSWFGIQNSYGIPAGGTVAVAGAVALAATGALLVLWVVTVDVIHRRSLPSRGVWGVFAAWAAPLAIGPPLFDTSIYRYAAFGLVQRAGDDPYRTLPTSLGYARIVEAVDTDGRGVTSGVGPLGTLVEHVASSVGVGDALLIVIALRVLALVSVVWIGRVAVGMARNGTGVTLALTALNPLLLLFVVSAGRIEGPMTALVISAVAAASRRTWKRALGFAAAAGSVLAPAFVAVLAIGAAHLRTTRRRPVWRTIALDAAVVAAVVAVLGLIVPDGFGWLRTARDQFATHTPFSVTGATGAVLSPIVRGSTYDTLATSARLAAVIAAAAVIVTLLATAGRRPLDRTAGYSLLALGLLAPNFYPWFVIAGVVCLAPRADRTIAVWLLALSAGACLLVPGGFGQHTTDAVISVSLAAVAVATLISERRHLLPAISRTAGRTSAR